MYATISWSVRTLPAAQLSGLRILLLEDEALIAFDVEQLCRDNGAEDIVIASTLQDALSVSQPFDVAIIDVMLDGEPTLDFAKNLEANGVPFVFATGYDRIDEIFSGFPGVGLISKPYSGTDLVEAVVASIAKPAPSADR